MIKSGYLYGYSRQGNTKKIQNIVGPGNIFPLLWGDINIQKRFYVEALTEVTISFLDRDFFLRSIDTNKNLTKALIQTLASYLSVYVERVENLEMDNMEKKLIGRLLHFASRFGKEDKKGILIDIPLTHSFIAQSINIARENVTRELGKLVNERIIAFEKGNIIILNKEKLKEKQ